MKSQRLSVCLAGVMAVCALTGYGAGGEVYYIVKVQEMTKEVTTSVMSATEFKALEKTIQQENQYFSAAVTAAAKEWRENEDNKGVPFIGSRVSPRKLLPGSSERFSSADKAQEKLTAIETLEAKKLEREAAKTKTGKGTVKTKDSKKEFDLMAAQELIQNKLTEIIESKAAGAPAAGAKGADQPATKAPNAAPAEAVKRAL